MKKPILPTYAAVIIPFTPANWHILKYDKIEPNKVTFDRPFTIEVNESAGPIFYLKVHSLVNLLRPQANCIAQVLGPQNYKKMMTFISGLALLMKEKNNSISFKQ
jgi:hypothetical protein